jgi:hypothetical protein
MLFAEILQAAGRPGSPGSGARALSQSRSLRQFATRLGTRCVRTNFFVHRGRAAAMSVTYSILSPLAPQEMLELERASVSAVEAFLEEHPECEDEWGEMGAGGSIPDAEEVRGAYASSGLVLDAEIVERLGACRSVFSIERPGDIAGGLQVSILCFLLERTGDSLVLLNDYPFEKSEALLAKLRTRPGAKGFGAVRPAKRRSAARRDAKPGELRAVRVLRILERAVNDVRVAIDVKGALHSVSEVARNYGALLLEEGAVPDPKAAKALGIDLAELIRAADELERALTRR